MLKPVGILMEEFNCVIQYLVTSSPFTPIEYDRLIAASNISCYMDIEVSSWLNVIMDVSVGLECLHDLFTNRYMQITY